MAERHPRVVAYVKNHNLGLEVPYRYGSETRKYRPDFIVQINDGHGSDDLLNLIVEIKGYRGEDAKDKKLTMETYWVPGVNNLGTYGRWAFVEFVDVYQMQHDFSEKVAAEFELMLEHVTGLRPPDVSHHMAASVAALQADAAAIPWVRPVLESLWRSAATRERAELTLIDIETIAAQNSVDPADVISVLTALEGAVRGRFSMTLTDGESGKAVTLRDALRKRKDEERDNPGTQPEWDAWASQVSVSWRGRDLGEVFNG